MRKKVKVRKVRASFSKSHLHPELNNSKRRIYGYFEGKITFISFYDRYGRYVGVISGNRLYRLAKAIVRHYEADKS